MWPTSIILLTDNTGSLWLVYGTGLAVIDQKGRERERERKRERERERESVSVNERLRAENRKRDLE